MSTVKTDQPDLEAIKAKQQATWSSGDFGQIGTRLQIVGESLCEAIDVLATDKILDVAAGNGNASLAAARHFADVTSTDYVPALLEEGKRRAEADMLPMKFQVADAENLPFADHSFDKVLSTFGVMFAPNQPKAASELARVVRPGGKIGLANWTPEGFIGELFGVMKRFVPPPAGLQSPMRWGTEAGLREMFGPKVKIQATKKAYMFRYQSPQHWIDIFRSYYGPTHKAFAALDLAQQDALNTALLEFLNKWNRPGEATLVVAGDYLEVIITT